MKLPLKLAILVIVIFGLLCIGMVLWRPMKVRHYAGKYAKAETPAERIRIVDILCACGEGGKKALYEVFRKRCISEQVKIPAGSFMMGSEEGEDKEKPVHEVTLSSFWMDKYEVTSEKYYVFVKSKGHKTPKHWENGKIPTGYEQHPVVYVTWFDAKAYADWLGMRLPTEAQWEYACRAGSTTEYCFGDNAAGLDEYAWYPVNARLKGILEPLQVGQKKRNKWGLYDMHGNVMERCSDWHSENYYSNSPAENPKGPATGKFRVVRGGSWDTVAWRCRSAKRDGSWPMRRDGDMGFRVSRSFGR